MTYFDNFFFFNTCSRCPEESKSQVRGIYVQCNEQTTCESCVHTHRCGWCPLSNSCVHDIEQCTAPMNKDDVPFRSERVSAVYLDDETCMFVPD